MRGTLQTYLFHSPLGKKVILAGGFKDRLRTIVMIKGTYVASEEMECDQEEADTRIICQVLNAAADHATVIIQSPDTDVAVLSLFHFQELHCEELWFRTGTEDKTRFIPLHEIHAVLGPLMCSAILGLHALSGCDSFSYCSGI